MSQCTCAPSTHSNSLGNNQLHPLYIKYETKPYEERFETDLLSDMMLCWNCLSLDSLDSYDLRLSQALFPKHSMDQKAF